MKITPIGCDGCGWTYGVKNCQPINDGFKKDVITQQPQIKYNPACKQSWQGKCLDVTG